VGIGTDVIWGLFKKYPDWNCNGYSLGGMVCNQSWHVHTCRSNSWQKLQVAAFAHLAVVGCGSNTCVYVIVIFMMCESTKQCICIKFCFKIRKTATEMYQLLQQAYGEDAMGRTQVFDWFHRFKEGRTSVKSNPHSGQPSTSRNEEMIAKVRTIIRNNRRLTVWEIVGDCEISVGSCDAILTNDLHMKPVCAKFVPRLLTGDQREHRQTIAGDLLERSYEDVQFLKNIMIGDESWVYGYDPETKQQSSQWKGPSAPQPKKGHQVRSKTKVMLLAFFDSEGIIHDEYAPDGQIINKEFYLEVLRHLCESVRRKDMAGWRLDPAPRQCAHTHFTPCAAVFGQTAPLSCSSHHTHHITPHVTFSYSQGLRKFWKDTNLRQRRTSNKIRRRHY